MGDYTTATARFMAPGEPQVPPPIEPEEEPEPDEESEEPEESDEAEIEEQSEHDQTQDEELGEHNLLANLHLHPGELHEPTLSQISQS
jgi:hypothetical protein